MGDGRRIAGLDTAPSDSGGANERLAPRGMFVTPGPTDDQNGEEEIGSIPICGRCEVIVDLAARRTTPEIHSKGITLADLKDNLDAALGLYWGEGGGTVLMDPIPEHSVKAGEKFTVTLRGELFNRVPEWDDCSSATPAARAEWDRFIAKLRAHEECHVEIAKKAFKAIQRKLRGTRINLVEIVLAKADDDLKALQIQLDDERHTDHGKKPGIACGDAELNAAIL